MFSDPVVKYLPDNLKSMVVLYLINENLICLACRVIYFYGEGITASVVEYLFDNLRGPVVLQS